jgi:hypothetical protein
MSSYRSLALAGMFLLFGAAAPVHASLTSNSLTSNSLTSNSLTSNSLTNYAVTQNALVATGSAIADLNGVSVEEVSLPKATKP